ncbi:MAG: T9SS type A sorting domain-containing protein [Bacteroidetes bacterium]|nr:T9SS type A sorting domain-containing protein [Bacteroidota bacterium]
MKKLLLLFVLTFVLPAYSQWEPQQSGVTTSLNDVYCISENTVVIVGDSGTILKTTDGGEHWISKISSITEHIIKVQFVNANVGYAITSAGTVLKTSDGGETWSSRANSISNYNSNLSCVNENTLFVSNGTLLKSTDGGQTFTTITTPANVRLIQFFNEQVGYISCDSGFYKTTDGGATWANLVSNSNYDSIFFINENIGFLANYNGYSKTTDGGQTFTEFPIESGVYQHGFVSDIFATNENTVWDTNTVMMLCWCTYYCISKLDWNVGAEKPFSSSCEDFPNEYDQYKAIHFANETTGYIVGFSSSSMSPPTGIIYKNTTGTMPSMGITKNQKDIFTIYPNPAQDNIHLSFEKVSSSNVSVEIVDGLGQTVLKQEYATAASISINTQSFAKGVYFLTVDDHQNKQTQKIIIY